MLRTMFGHFDIVTYILGECFRHLYIIIDIFDEILGPFDVPINTFGDSLGLFNVAIDIVDDSFDRRHIAIDVVCNLQVFCHRHQSLFFCEHIQPFKSILNLRLSHKPLQKLF